MRDSAGHAVHGEGRGRLWRRIESIGGPSRRLERNVGDPSKPRRRAAVRGPPRSSETPTRSPSRAAQASPPPSDACAPGADRRSRRAGAARGDASTGDLVRDNASMGPAPTASRVRGESRMNHRRDRPELRVWDRATADRDTIAAARHDPGPRRVGNGLLQAARRSPQFAEPPTSCLDSHRDSSQHRFWLAPASSPAASSEPRTPRRSRAVR